MSAKNKFEKLNSKVDKVADISAKKANVITLKNISNADLIDYPNNQEDTENTTDIENSIDEIGFIDPIEVTDFNMPDGKFMIVSGHRRRAGGVKRGIDIFPCFLKHFESESEVRNYVLLANSHRDSSKDPLLMPKRVKMHFEYLTSIKFKGSKREEVAKRLGVSASQVDRYNDMNSVILPIWDMVRNDIVSISGVSPLASRTPEQQEEIYLMMKDCLENGGELNRPTMKIIIDAHTNGIRHYNEIISVASATVPYDNDKESGEPENGLINDNKEKLDPVNTNDGADNKITPIKENIPTVKSKNYNNESGEDTETGASKEDKNSNKAGQDIIIYLENIDNIFNNNLVDISREDAERMIDSFRHTFDTAIKKIQSISKEKNLDDVYIKFLKDLVQKGTIRLNTL